VKALITGAGGFCGSHLIHRLEADGVEVHSVSTRRIDRIRHHTIADVTDIEALSAVLHATRPNYVFHLAGVTSAPDPAAFYRVNSAYAASLLAALAVTECCECPVLLVGSSAEYGSVPANELPIEEDQCPHPLSHYGISKLAQTHIGLAASRSGCRVVVVRPFNVVGPGMPEHLALQSFATQIRRIGKGLSQPVIEVGNLNASRDFVDVRDAVETYWKAIRSKTCHGQVLNVCSGHATRLSDVLSMLLSRAGVEAEIRQDPARIRALEAETHFGSTRKLDALLGAKPRRPLRETLGDVLAHTLPES
jgi:GDP-4-dehydro-6-deoxy-D-mannose reductase